MNQDEVALSALLTNNKARLEWAEDQMRKGLRAFAEGLKDIREAKTWKLRDSPYASFDDYCRKKLGFTENRASQIITAGSNLLALSEATKGEPELQARIGLLPEGAVRELKGVPTEVAVEVVRAAAKKGKITRATLREALNKPKAEKKCPHCGGVL